MYLRSSVLLAMLAWCCATPLVVLPPQEASPTLLLALPSQEREGLKETITPKTIVLEQFTWTDVKSGLNPGGTLEVCTDTELYTGGAMPVPTDEIIHIVIILRNDDDTILMEHQGKISYGRTCAEFDLDTNPISEKSEKFTMVTKNEAGTEIKKGSAEFSLQLTSVQFSCNGKDMVRTNNVGGLPVPPKDKECLPFSDSEAQNGVCYVDGATLAAGDQLCVTVADSEPTGVVVCQAYVEGTKLDDEPLKEISLLYNEDGLSRDLSYVFNDVADVSSSETIVWVVDGNGDVVHDDATKVYAGTETGFPLDGEPNDSKYEVCAISLKGAADTAQPSAVRTGEIQDCKFISYNDKDLLEFGFNNHNKKKLYEANSIKDDDTVTGTVKMDCTKVEPDTTCYGFLDVAGKTGRLELTYDGVGAIKNKIVTLLTNTI